MDIKQYLDSTYLKTAEQASISEQENEKIVAACIQEAIDERFKLIMIRPQFVKLAKQMITEQKSEVLVGTVIGFHEGTTTIEEKLNEAEQAVQDGVDELDYVVNFQAFKDGIIDLVKNEVLLGTKFGLSHNRVVKWIIETAALDGSQIIQLSSLIKNVVIAHFKETDYDKVFVKSSTGFYKTENGLPNGATIPAVKAMLENAFPLPVKASGGVKTQDDAIEMIKLGVKRIGTSSAKAIVEGKENKSDY